MRRRQLLGLLGAGGTVMPDLSSIYRSRHSVYWWSILKVAGMFRCFFDPKFSSRQIDTASDGETPFGGWVNLCRFS